MEMENLYPLLEFDTQKVDFFGLMRASQLGLSRAPQALNPALIKLTY